MREVEFHSVELDTTHQGCCYCEPLNLKQCCCASIILASSPVLNIIIVASPWPRPFSYPLFCIQLLKHVANAMQCAEGFVLERALVINEYCSRSINDKFL